MSKKMITLTGNNGLRWRAVITPAGIRRAQLVKMSAAATKIGEATALAGF